MNIRDVGNRSCFTDETCSSSLLTFCRRNTLTGRLEGCQRVWPSVTHPGRSSTG